MLTPFEQGGTWATPVEEADYLASVASAHTEVDLEIAAVSEIGDHPIHRVTITTAPPSAPAVMVLGSQHGDEPAGREAALRFVRDIVDSPALLSTVRFVVIPSPSPEAAAANRRATATPTGNVDMNRDHLQVRTVGARLIQQTITDYAPVALVDCHEWETAGQPNAVHAMTKSSRHPQADTTLANVAAGLDAAIRAELTAQGFANTAYEQSTSPDTLSNQATLRHCAAILIETPRVRPPAERVEMYRHSLNAMMSWLGANLAAVTDASAGSRTRKIQEGKRRDSPFNLLTEIIDPPPRGYANLQSWPDPLTVLGVEGSTAFVGMGQAAQPLIPHLLDPMATAPVTVAERVAGPVPQPPPDPTYATGGVPQRIRVANGLGVTEDVEAVRVGTPEGTVTVWQR